MKCPRYHSNEKQYKAGFNQSKSQRYHCGECNRVYTPEPQPQGYSSETRMLALRMYVEGSSQWSIGRILKVSLQTVANWISSYTSKLPPTQMPKKPDTAELDEMCIPFYSRKKQSLHHNCGRPSQLLYSELGCCSYKNQCCTASMLGKSTSNQTALQWRISCLWHTVLWSTVRNANGQERNIFGGSRQCRFATLLEAIASQIQMLFQKSRRFVQEHSLVFLLLQSEADYEKTISKIFLSPHWFLMSSLLDTPPKITQVATLIAKTSLTLPPPNGRCACFQEGSNLH